MRIININETVKLSSPHPFGLILTRDEEKINVMGVSWFCFTSLNPPAMLACLSDKGYTGKAIVKTGKFALCLPTEKIKKESMACSKCSGHEGDKIKKIGLKLITPPGFDLPVVVGCKIAWELKLSQTVPAEDHTVYFADILRAVEMEKDDHLFAKDGYASLAAIRMK